MFHVRSGCFGFSSFARIKWLSAASVGALSSGLAAPLPDPAHAQSPEPASYDVLYGGMVEVPEGSGGTRLGFGPMGRDVVSMTTSRGDVVTTSYAPGGGRAQDTAPSSQTDYLYAAALLPAAEWSGGAMTYYLGLSSGDAVLRAGTAEYVIADTLDTTRGVMSGGGMMAGYGYGVSGTVVQGLGETGTTPYLFQGRRQIAGKGLYDNGARVYAPGLGRFTHTDLLGASIAPYTALGNNPINLTDPDGMMPQKDRDKNKKQGNGRGNASGQGQNISKKTARYMQQQVKKDISIASNPNEMRKHLSVLRSNPVYRTKIYSFVRADFPETSRAAALQNDRFGYLLGQVWLNFSEYHSDLEAWSKARSSDFRGETFQLEDQVLQRIFNRIMTAESTADIPYLFTEQLVDAAINVRLASGSKGHWLFTMRNRIKAHKSALAVIAANETREAISTARRAEGNAPIPPQIIDQMRQLNMEVPGAVPRAQLEQEAPEKPKTRSMQPNLSALGERLAPRPPVPVPVVRPRVRDVFGASKVTYSDVVSVLASRNIAFRATSHGGHVKLEFTGRPSSVERTVDLSTHGNTRDIPNSILKDIIDRADIR